MDKVYKSRRITSGDASSTITIDMQNIEVGYVVILTTSAHALTFADGNVTKFATKASVAEQTIPVHEVYANSLKITVPAGYNGEAVVYYR